MILIFFHKIHGNVRFVYVWGNKHADKLYNFTIPLLKVKHYIVKNIIRKYTFSLIYITTYHFYKWNILINSLLFANIGIWTKPTDKKVKYPLHQQKHRTATIQYLPYLLMSRVSAQYLPGLLRSRVSAQYLPDLLMPQVSAQPPEKFFIRSRFS